MAHSRRNGQRRFAAPPQPKPTQEELVQILRRQAIARMEGFPPHEPAEAVVVQHDMGYGKIFSRAHKGVTKREMVAMEFCSAAIMVHGLPASDAEMQSFARRSIVMSEHFFQALNAQREKDIGQMMNEISDVGKKQEEEEQGDVVSIHTLDDEDEEEENPAEIPQAEGLGTEEPGPTKTGYAPEAKKTDAD